jgi:hypothetical protein
MRANQNTPSATEPWWSCSTVGDAHGGDAVDNSPNGDYYFDIPNNTKAALNWLRSNVPSPGKVLISGRSWSRFTSWLRGFIVSGHMVSHTRGFPSESLLNFCSARYLNCCSSDMTMAAEGGPLLLLAMKNPENDPSGVDIYHMIVIIYLSIYLS